MVAIVIFITLWCAIGIVASAMLAYFNHKILFCISLTTYPIGWLVLIVMLFYLVRHIMKNTTN